MYKDNTAFYGVTTTAAEAVQLVECALGLGNAPLWAAPLLNGKEHFDHEPVEWLAQDRIFVEVSSNKMYTLDGIQISPALLRRFFGGRTQITDAILRYWGKDETSRRWAAIADDPEVSDATPDELWIIRNLQVSIQDNESIMVDLRRLHALLGDRLLLVSSVRAEARAADDGAGSGDLVSVVRRSGDRLGVPVIGAHDAYARAHLQYDNGTPKDNDPYFLTFFEDVLSEEIGEKYLEPIRRKAGRVMDHSQSRVRRGTKWRPSFLWQPKNFRVDEALSREQVVPDSNLLISDAAWIGSWREIMVHHREAITSTCDIRPSWRQIFQAAWYTGHDELALRLAEDALQSGAVGGATALEVAELACQLAQWTVAAEFYKRAAELGCEFADEAMQLAVTYNRPEILKFVGAKVFPRVHLRIAARLPRDSPVRQRIVEDFLDKWDGAPLEPSVEDVLLHALRSYTPGGGLAHCRRIVLQCALCADGQLAAAGRAMMVRMLQSALAAAEALGDWEQAESIATELVQFDPTHAKAVTCLARLRNGRSEFGVAAELLEKLALAHPGSAAIQILCISQWLQVHDFHKAAHALTRSRALHGQNQKFSVHHRRLTSLIERRRQNASEPLITELDRLLTDLTALPLIRSRSPSS